MRSENRISNFHVALSANNFISEIPKGADTANDCCKVIISVYLFLIILMGILGYYIFGISYVVLNSYQDTKDLCPTSNVWVFTVVSLVVRYPLNIVGLMISSFKKGIEMRYLFKLFIINSLFIIWGGIELTKLSCTEQQLPTSLYKLLRFDFVGSITVMCLCSYLSYLLPHNRNNDPVLY